MSYYLNTTVNGKSFEEAIASVTEELKKEGFGVLSTIDMSGAFKNKLNVDFKKYTILGACNPHYAYKVLQTEDKLGVFLPCNVVVEENDNGSVDISIVDPVSSMTKVDNKHVEGFAAEVQEKLQLVINNLN
ncbi:MAG TPA: DUF302 domain-containing protein [Draconibacterium sp.]|nr:DUF302 domain-containing protein [Draconibacterium sp.]